jgi:hypothetical protein
MLAQPSAEPWRAADAFLGRARLRFQLARHLEGSIYVARRSATPKPRAPPPDSGIQFSSQFRTEESRRFLFDLRSPGSGCCWSRWPSRAGVAGRAGLVARGGRCADRAGRVGAALGRHRESVVLLERARRCDRAGRRRPGEDERRSRAPGSRSGRSGRVAISEARASRACGGRVAASGARLEQGNLLAAEGQVADALEAYADAAARARSRSGRDPARARERRPHTPRCRAAARLGSSRAPPALAAARALDAGAERADFSSTSAARLCAQLARGATEDALRAASILGEARPPPTPPRRGSRPPTRSDTSASCTRATPGARRRSR